MFFKLVNLGFNLQMRQVLQNMKESVVNAPVQQAKAGCIWLWLWIYFSAYRWLAHRQELRQT